MKAKTIAMLTAAFFAGVEARAEGTLSFSLFGGYAGILPNEFNKSLKENLKYYNLQSEAPPSEEGRTDINGGYQGGIGIGYDASEHLTLGLRVAYAMSSKGEVTYLSDSGSVKVSADNSTTFSVLPIVVGGAYRHPLGETFVLSIGLYGGMGLASGSQDFNELYAYNAHPLYGTSETRLKGTAKYAGSAFAADVLAGIAYKLSPAVSVGLELGYRMFSTQLKIDGNVDLDGNGTTDIKDGETLKDSKGDAAKYDLGGALGLLSITYHL